LAINKNFVVKHGLEVNTNLILAKAETGRIGIGTTNPSSRFNVYNTSESKVVVESLEQEASIVIDSGITSTSYIEFKQDGTLKSNITFDSANSDSLEINSRTNKNVVIASGGGEVGIGTTNPSALFQVGPGPSSVVITNSSGIGSVGIGTVTPTSNLHVVGTTLLIGDTIQTSGSVGISTRNPIQRFQIGTRNDFVPAVSVAGSIGISTDIITGIDTSGIFVGYELVGITTIVSVGTTVTSIGSGTVGIGTTTLNTTSSLSGVSFTFGFRDDSKVFVVTSDAKTGIGTTNPTSKLHVVGDTLVTGVSTFVGFSTFNNDVYVAGLSTFASNVHLLDNKKLYLGDGNDLEIYHSGTDSYIKDAGTGNLIINSNNVQIKNAADNETLASFIENGQVELYYDNSKKFETIGTGITITGDTFTNQLSVSGVSTFVNGTVFIGSGTTTGTELQTLQVTGGVYVSENIGIGTTRPTSKLQVVGTSLVTGIATFKDRVIFDSKNSIQIPAGTTAERDSVGTAVTGQIRYNTEYSTFEGFGPGGSWGSLGGVRDVDGNTYIVPETAPGANENTLFFVTDGTEKVQINPVGNVGIATTNPTSKLHVVGNTLITGVSTFNDNVVIAGELRGPANFIIDPAAVGDNTGAVRIRGDLYVDGTQFQVNSSTIELADLRVGIATTVGTNLLLDGGGIGIGSTNILKSFTYNYSSDALKSSENLDLASGKVYKIDGTELLSSNQVTVPNANISGVSTLSNTVVGGATTQLVVNGDTRITGILTIGSSSVTLNGTTNAINVGTGLTLTSNGINATGIVTASTFYGTGGFLTLGAPDDGALTSSGALNTLSSSSKIVNSIDDLNELAFNIIRNTAVTNVDFSSNSVAGGSPLSITLSVTSSGNANRYDVDWGDGTTTSDYSSASIPHTYTQPAGGQFSISLVAKNNTGVGAGSSYSTSKSSYITVYTPNPTVSFDLYRTSTGGSVLSGNDLYVIEGQSLYLDNNTSNTNGATVNYTMNWGDGSTNDSIANNTAAGGADVSASRLQHTWSDGTNSSTSRDTLTLTLNAHNTADPAVIPANGTALLKVYDDAPTAPDGLSSKTLSNVTSTGTSPRLVSGFTDNTGGTTLSAGNDVNRITGGTAEATATASFAYNANSGTLTAQVNGSSDGSRVLTSGDDSGTYTSLVITEESDYQLLNSSGSTTTFAASIYYPGLYKGFKAKVSKAVSALNVGVNSMRLLHSVTGNTNAVQFVKDDVTSTPVVSISTATLTENVAGTYRYVSGIPYYNSGSPSLTLSGLTVTNLTGQTYTNQSDIVEVDTGTNQEGTSSAATTDSDYTYSQINGPSSMLSGGIPIANVGVSSPYATGSLTVPITSSSVRTVDRVRVRAKNVNGTSSYTSDISTNIQVHTAAQSGISEISIAVPSGLGDGTYTDNGKRIYDFGPGVTTTTPSYNGATNFYTNNPYSESSSPAGITTTAEAVVRLGAITHNQVNYSAGYLPVGPDFSSGRSGTQYFTFAFRRRVVANFDINITSSTGVAGVWIAAPGTSIDTTSGLNGWLRADTAYGGSGVPGSGPGGNGSDGCAFTNGDRILTSTSLSGGYTMTLGSENMSNATGNVVLIRIALNSGQSVTSLSIGVAA